MNENSGLLQLLILIAFTSFSSEFCQPYAGDYNRIYCYSFEWSDLENYSNKYELYILNSYIYDIKPAAFRRENRLWKLSMPGNNITILEVGAFTGLTNLKFLNLSANNIEIISKGLFSGAYKLEILDLSNNNIVTIENSSFVGTDRLQSLYLHNNKLISMPPIWDSCENLNTIDISNNKIQKFAFEKLSPSTIYLNISGNELNSVSAEDFINLPKLKELSLSRNTLFDKNNFPVGLFQNLKQLRMLNLSSTAIRKINIGSFSGLQFLQILDISSNDLTSLPNGLFHDLEYLKELDISNNRLSYYEYDGISQLRNIALDKNLWNCNSLSVMVHKLRGTAIKRGNTFNATNLFGIECFEEVQENITAKSYNTSSSLERQILSQIIKIQTYNENALTKLTDILQMLKNDTSVMTMIIKNTLSSKIEMQKTTAHLPVTLPQPIQTSKTFSPSSRGTTVLYGIFVVLLGILLIILFSLYRRYKHVKHSYNDSNPLHSLSA